MDSKALHKVVINTSYGGFMLSKKAEKLLNERLGIDEEWYELPDGIYRHSPEFVKFVEEMKAEGNGECDDLEVCIIIGDRYYIETYDEGKEHVITPDTIEWVTIKSTKAKR
jgi:hypothetical protein